MDISIMPLAKLMGIEVIEASPAQVIADLLARPDLCTAGSILHGGSYMAFADCLGALATALNLPAGFTTTTIESKTNFLRAVKEGETARGECAALHIGRTTMVWQTRILRPDGKLAALVTQTQMAIALQPSS